MQSHLHAEETPVVSEEPRHEAPIACLELRANERRGDEDSAAGKGAAARNAAPDRGSNGGARRGDVEKHVVERAQRGEASALEAIVRHYQGPVFAFISRSTGRGPHVDDLAQETFLRVFRALPRFEFRGAKFSTWIFQIAVRLIQDRRKRSTPVLVEYNDELTRSGGAMERECDARRELTRLETLVENLSEDQRMALVLVEFHGQSLDEAAVILQCATGTVKSRLSRARNQLREGLREGKS